MRTVFMIGVVILLIVSAHAETVFILNPEAGAGNIRFVKQEIERHLISEGIDCNVHIFVNPVDFDTAVERYRPDIAIVASYFYSLRSEKYQWRLLLSGNNSGSTRFSKILVAKKNVGTIQDLRNKNIAAVSFGPETESIINIQLSPGLSTAMVRIISVSKDIDAIMALAFDQVTAAIVTRESFDRLKGINLEMAGTMRILRSLNPIDYPMVVAFPEGKNIDKIRAALKRLSSKDILKYFGVTGFI